MRLHYILQCVDTVGWSTRANIKATMWESRIPSISYVSKDPAAFESTNLICLSNINAMIAASWTKPESPHVQQHERKRAKRLTVAILQHDMPLSGSYVWHDPRFIAPLFLRVSREQEARLMDVLGLFMPVMRFARKESGVTRGLEEMVLICNEFRIWEISLYPESWW